MSDIENRDFEYYLKESKKFVFDYENHDDALNALHKANDLDTNFSYLNQLIEEYKIFLSRFNHINEHIL